MSSGDIENEIVEIVEALTEARDVLALYADADQPDPSLPPLANKAMLAQMRADAALRALSAKVCP